MVPGCARAGSRIAAREQLRIAADAFRTNGVERLD